MLASKWVVLTVVCVLALTMLAVAGSMPGVADVQKISFDAPIRIGDNLLPQGSYEVRHVMEGENHIMVFRDLNRKKAPEVRTKCTLVALGQKADQTQKVYTLNTKNEQVLQALIFRGDTAKHVFE